MQTNVYQQYKEQSLSTMSPGEILVKLFDELIKQMHIALRGLEKNELGVVNDALTKSTIIVSTLESSLNMKYEISDNLHNLYIFIGQQLIEANEKKEAQPVLDCMSLVRDLRDSFEQADKISRKEQRSNLGRRAV